MRKLIFLMVLLVVSNSAMAEWVTIVKNKDGYFYADKDTIQRNGGMVLMWKMDDYKNPKIIQAWNTYKSTKEHNEYDCNEGRTRKLALEIYVENMGFGKLLRRDTSVDEWILVPPGSITELVWKFACGKK